jgi:hypothetical protein
MDPFQQITEQAVRTRQTFRDLKATMPPKTLGDWSLFGLFVLFAIHFIGKWSWLMWEFWCFYQVWSKTQH